MKRVLSILMLATLAFTACNKDDDDEIMLSQKDRDFITKASFGNNAEVSAGQMAATKGMNLSIRDFGQMMVDDHTMAQTELAGLAGRFSVTPPAGLDSAHQQLAQQLQALSGYSFDSLYINSQIMDHNTTIALFEDERVNGTHPDLKSYAEKYLPKLKMHLQKADSVKNSL